MSLKVDEVAAFAPRFACRRRLERVLRTLDRLDRVLRLDRALCVEWVLSGEEGGGGDSVVSGTTSAACDRGGLLADDLLRRVERRSGIVLPSLLRRTPGVPRWPLPLSLAAKLTAHCTDTAYAPATCAFLGDRLFVVT